MLRVLRSIYGQYVGTASDFRLIASKGIILGDWGDQNALPGPNRVVLDDDFLGAVLSTKWGVAKGSDAATVNFAIAAAANGTIAATTGAGATTTMAVNGAQISAGLNFQANGGGLQFNTRVKLSAITNVALFIGLTNQIASLQMPINGSGTANGLTNTANDAVGILFDTGMTTADYWLVGVKGGTGATPQDAKTVPVAGTYDQFAISIDDSGNANFFQNGAQVGITMPNAVTSTVGLTPVIAAFSRSAASRTVTADKIYASMKRI